MQHCNRHFEKIPFQIWKFYLLKNHDATLQQAFWKNTLPDLTILFIKNHDATLQQAFWKKNFQIWIFNFFCNCDATLQQAFWKNTFPDSNILFIKSQDATSQQAFWKKYPSDLNILSIKNFLSQHCNKHFEKIPIWFDYLIY